MPRRCPRPSKMSLPPPTEVHLNALKRRMNSRLESYNSKPEEREWAKNVRYDYYLESIKCVQQYLEGRSHYPFERSLTTEERRGLRDLLYRLQREMAEGQANGTVGHEGHDEVWRRHREAQKKKK
jgi:hypothetical protein